MKVQQTLAQTWKRRRDSDHAEAKRYLPNCGSAALRWYGHSAELTPGLNVVWRREPGPQDDPAHWYSHSSALKVTFTWNYPNEIVEQSLDDVRSTLEHYLHWE